jgi:hypothetical protein
LRTSLARSLLWRGAVKAAPFRRQRKHFDE